MTENKLGEPLTGLLGCEFRYQIWDQPWYQIHSIVGAQSSDQLSVHLGTQIEAHVEADIRENLRLWKSFKR